MTKNQNPSQTNVNQVKKQNQQSANPNSMGEEFGSETDVNQVKQQNQQSVANKNKKNATGQSTNQFENGSR